MSAQTGHRPFGPREWIPAATGLLVFVTLLLAQLGPIAGPRQDFAVYHAGVGLTWSGVWPYDLERIQAPSADRLGMQPSENRFGYFLSPAAAVVLAPWGLLPWRIADPAWVATLTVCLVACGTLARTYNRRPDRRGIGTGLVVGVILLSPLIHRAVSLGQLSIFIAGCVALGQFAFERRRPVLGSVLWSVAVIKPHLAIALLLAAWYGGGWRRAAGIMLVMTALWVGGCAFFGEPITTTWKYLQFLQSSHKVVGFNRVTEDQIVSWNRLLYVCGGPAIDLSFPAVLAGVGVAVAVLWLRHVRGKPRPPAAWALAAAVTFGPFTAQVLGYELGLLILTAPYLFHLYDNRRYRDVGFLLAVLAVVSVPRGVVAAAAGRMGLGEPALAFALSYRTIALAGAVLYLLVRRPEPSA